MLLYKYGGIMIGILYFSSTGNSLYIAKKLKENLGGKIFYLPKYSGDGSEFEKIILVTPIYSFGMPKLVYDFLPKLDKSKELIVVQNYGGMVAGADYLMREYCTKNDLNLKSIYVVQMPENFTLSFSVPKFYLKKVLKKADSKILAVVDAIKNEKYNLPKKRKTKEKTYLKNMSNWYKIGKGFKTNENCVKCGKCIGLCPVGNISIVDGKIVFGDKCVACLGCYHRCPNKAIVYKNKKKKNRYINPNINENEIGQDI